MRAELDQQDFKAKSREWLNLFGLWDRANELIEAYSHGMKQRLIMSAALLHDPKLLIVDEPMVGLDPAGIKMVKKLFKNLSRKGVTIFMSTHTLKIAEDVCDRIGIINEGQLIAVGTMQELRALGKGETSLEDIFLNLTGGAEYAEIAEVLK